MTKNKLVLGAGIAILCLLVCLCVVMCSPAQQGPAVEAAPTEEVETPGTTGTGTREYIIEIKNQGGQPLEEIGVYIYTDQTLQELVWFARTDAQGRLSFEDVASDNFVAVLSDVPAGYLVEEFYPMPQALTQIVLESGLMEGDLTQLDYKLGDLMLDFTVTDPEGKEYTLSQLLQEKKAIVLNFWYLQCQPCKSEFPFLQEAYENHSQDLAVLAMNPVNQEDAEIAAFRQENGYTFPMMKCDPAWEKAMNITAYPTTVVIDRFGNICMIHKGAVTETETFDTIFSFFTADDYTQTVVKDLEELEEAAGVEQTQGTKDNPVEIGVTPSFQITIEPGQSMYYNIYRITGTIYLSVNDPSISVVHGGNTYEGPVYIPLTSEGTSTAVPLVFTNTGTETKTYTVSMGRAAGTYDNPHKLSLGDFTAKVAAGNESGVYYTYTAEKSGLFVVDVQSVTSGVNYNIVAYNLTTYALRNSQDDGSEGESGYKSVGVNVSKGDKIQVIVGTLPDSTNSYPAATFKLNADIREGESEGTAQQKLISYSINVTDENRKPIPNVRMSLNGDQTNVLLTTNADGYALSKQKAGNYSVVITVPTGYSARTETFTLTEQYPSVSVKLDTVIVEMQTYTIRVLDNQGQPIVGAFVSVGTGFAVTDENGVAQITVPKGTYIAQISADGYALGNAELSEDSTSAEITLEEGEVEKLEYTVTVRNYFGQPVSGVTLAFKQLGAVRATAITDDQGVATASLAAGDYTVAIPEGYYTPEEENLLTQENTSVSILAVNLVTGETDNLYDNPTPILQLGATYVDGLQSSTDNYFLFVPEVDGQYRFTGLYTQGSISYWGNNTNFITNITGTTDYDSATNAYTLNIKPSHLGSTFVLGLSGDTQGVILIERIGDAVLDITDMEETPYVGQQPESGFRLKVPAGQKLTYVDVFDKVVTWHKGSDGYYHLNSPTGPVLYVNLGDSAPYLAMSKCMGVTDEHAVYKLVYVYYDENGTPIKKESYNACMTEYVKARCPSTDVYPLNDDLIFILQQASLVKGWGDISSVDYMFYDANGEKIPGVIPEIAWMYACCYLS